MNIKVHLVLGYCSIHVMRKICHFLSFQDKGKCFWLYGHDMLEIIWRHMQTKPCFITIESSGSASRADEHCMMLATTLLANWTRLGSAVGERSVTMPTALRPDWPACSSRCSSWDCPGPHCPLCYRGDRPHSETIAPPRRCPAPPPPPRGAGVHGRGWWGWSDWAPPHSCPAAASAYGAQQLWH